MAPHPVRSMAARDAADPSAANKPDTRPEPGPAPSGPAVHVPQPKPAATPTDPGPAPPGPAVEPKDKRA
jgi:hypothetical protein